MDKELSAHVSMETEVDEKHKSSLVNTMENIVIGEVFNNAKSEVIDHKEDAAKY